MRHATPPLPRLPHHVRTRLWAALCAVLVLAAGCTAPEAPAWRDWEGELYAQGLLRAERAPADAPFTNADLTRNFARIAFGIEPDLNNGSTGFGILMRWEQPIRWRLHATGPRAHTARQDVAATFERIARATGHDIAPAAPDADANVDIWYLGSDDYLHALDWARQSPHQGQSAQIRDFRANSLPCMSEIRFQLRPGRTIPPGGLKYALVLVRKGFGRPFTLTCFEEELAQIMGLANDDTRVRPSVFNDDEEFALLTTHDEMLLELLYAPDLAPGMTPEQAIPVVHRLVAERRPGG